MRPGMNGSHRFSLRESWPMPERAKASSQPAARPFANILAAYVPRFWGLSVFCA